MSMISPVHDAWALREEYKSGLPVPHIVIDDFLAPLIAEQISAELSACDIGGWWADKHTEQVGDLGMDDRDRFTPVTSTALRFLNTPEVWAFFSTLTSIGELRPDPAHLGGGVHVSLRDGRLAVRAGFNPRPDTGRQRRVNAMLFLNEQWDPAWNAQLELWAPAFRGSELVVTPRFNRLVAFPVAADDGYRMSGPTPCAPERTRFSLALFYCTADLAQDQEAPLSWESPERARGVV